MHKRQAIREALVTTLTGLTTTGANVFMNRVYPMDVASLPGLIIYAKSEAVEYVTMGTSRSQTRIAEFAVEGYVRGITDYDDQLDTIGAEVEAALETNRHLGGTVHDVKMTNVEMEFMGEGDQPLGNIVMTVQVQYRTVAGSVTA